MPILRKTILIDAASFDVTNDHDGHEVAVFATQPAQINCLEQSAFRQRLP